MPNNTPKNAPKETITEVVKADEKVVISSKNELIWEDVKRAVFNSAKFAWPLALMVLLGLQAGRTFEEVLPLVYAGVIQLLIDLGSKYLGADKYIVPKE